MEKSYASNVNDAKLMIAGIKANIEALSGRGLNAEYVADYEAIYSDALRLDNEQESLKAQLKTKTKELDNKMKELDKKTGYSKKTVKMDVEKTKWKEFGIKDKQ